MTNKLESAIDRIHNELLEVLLVPEQYPGYEVSMSPIAGGLRTFLIEKNHCKVAYGTVRVNPTDQGHSVVKCYIK